VFEDRGTDRGCLAQVFLLGTDAELDHRAGTRDAMGLGRVRAAIAEVADARLGRVSVAARHDRDLIGDDECGEERDAELADHIVGAIDTAGEEGAVDSAGAALADRSVELADVVGLEHHAVVTERDVRGTAERLHADEEGGGVVRLDRAAAETGSVRAIEESAVGEQRIVLMEILAEALEDAGEERRRARRSSSGWGRSGWSSVGHEGLGSATAGRTREIEQVENYLVSARLTIAELVRSRCHVMSDVARGGDSRKIEPMRVFVALLLSVLSLACGTVKSNSDAGDINPAEAVSVEITGPSEVTIGDAAVQLVATAFYDDSSSQDISGECTWAASTGAVVVNDGVVTAVTVGTTVITATCGALSDTHNLAVRPAPELYVSSYTGNSIMVFPLTANGDVAPVRRIAGAATLLSTPAGMWVDNGEIFVASQASVLVFPVTATGNVAPTRQITGASTGFTNIRGLTVVNGEIYVAIVTSGAANDIAVFPRNATGNVAPTRVITGVGTPHTSVQVVGNEMFVNIAGGGPTVGIYVLPATANGATVPIRSIKGAATGIINPIGFYASATEIFVSNLPGGGSQPSELAVWPLSANGDVAPSRRITGLAFASQSAIRGNELFVTNHAESSVEVFDLNASGAAVPIRTIAGAATTINGTMAAFVY
jgi:hypothetical protein